LPVKQTENGKSISPEKNIPRLENYHLVEYKYTQKDTYLGIGQDISTAEKWKTRLNKHKDSQAMTKTTIVDEDQSLANRSLNKPNGFDTHEKDDQNTRIEMRYFLQYFYSISHSILYQSVVNISGDAAKAIVVIIICCLLFIVTYLDLD